MLQNEAEVPKMMRVPSENGQASEAKLEAPIESGEKVDNSCQ